MPQLSLPKIKAISVFTQSVLCGVHSILYFLAGRQEAADPPLAAVSTASLDVSHSHCAVAPRVCDVAAFLADFGNGGDLAEAGETLDDYEINKHDPTQVLSPVIVVLTTLIGDCFMNMLTLSKMYRIFVVWDRKLISLVIPIIFGAAEVVAAALVGRALCNLPSGLGDGYLWPSVYAPMIAYFTTMLATNISTTLLLLGCIAWHEKKMRHAFKAEYVYKSPHWRVMKTIIQSEALYSAALVISLVLYALRLHASHIAFSMLPPLVVRLVLCIIAKEDSSDMVPGRPGSSQGITYTLVIASIGLSDVLEESLGDSARTERSNSSHYRPGHSAAGASLSPAGAIPLEIFVSPAVGGEGGDSMVELNALRTKMAEGRTGGDEEGDNYARAFKLGA
ncbi:hypothetical protein BN946_scf184873.g6 [Trametes cinnabarina]|uniref:Integral membrane protein n=1 Tax=Pycnoporus cinnabarinus TaxID=5643 RepID=A0A060SN19_PYCCI|nr:hypothetical protein BN946_scf184873.g6 [Trametes cinnabarina]